MSELDTMRRAQMYIDKLAQGIDPVSGREIPNDSVLNNVQLVRCFFYISGVLQRTINMEDRRQETERKQEFAITPQRLAGIQVKPYAIRITEFTKLLYESVGDPGMKQPNPTRFTNWLLEEGFLVRGVEANGKSCRVPTKAGEKIGITARELQGKYGSHLAIFYGPEAQRFLLDHYWTIVAK